ncbi:Serum paraoxonase/lactonase 3, partial [Quaeritorhiza haematococci]
MGVVPEKRDAIKSQGEVWVLDLETPDANPQKLQLQNLSRPLHPLGIEVFENQDTNTLELYMVNRPPNDASIEVFTLDPKPGQKGGLPKTLTHVRTLKHPLIRTPNSLAIVAPDTFYVSNDHWADPTHFPQHSAKSETNKEEEAPRPPGFQEKLSELLDTIQTHKFTQKVETYLGLPLSNVIFYNKGEAHIVANWLSWANGVAVSPDYKILYVAETTAGVIRAYRIEQQPQENQEEGDQDSLDESKWRGYPNGTLTPLKAVFAGFAVDNLSVEPTTGNVFAAGHPKALHLSLWVRNITIPYINDDHSLSPAPGLPSPPASIVQRFAPPPRRLHLVTRHDLVKERKPI